MEQNEMLAEYLYNHRKNYQVNLISWAVESLETNTWELGTHKKFLNVADELLSITDYETAKKIIDLNLFDI